MKQRLQMLRESVRAAKLRFLGLWRDAENGLLVRALTGLVLFVALVLGGSGVLVLKSLRPHVAHVEEEAHVASEVEGAKPDDAPAGLVGIRAIPKSIEKRQDGIPESDKDLVEPEISSGRGLASISTETEIPTAPYNPYVTYNDILGSTSEQASRVGRLAVDISFEADSHVTMTELQEREKEVKFVIGSLIAELSYDQLRGDEGRALLKKRIYQEINYLLKKGKIKDVLYGNFVMR